VNIQILQSSVAADLKWGGSICLCLFASLSSYWEVKDLLKLYHICQS